jgi:hypothetical protein
MISRPFADAAVRGDNSEERHKAVVTDPLMRRHGSDSRQHGRAHRRRPLGADGTPTLGLGLAHRLTPGRSRSLAHRLEVRLQ